MIKTVKYLIRVCLRVNVIAQISITKIAQVMKNNNKCNNTFQFNSIPILATSSHTVSLILIMKLQTAITIVAQ
jgi:hypothetical protein